MEHLGFRGLQVKGSETRPSRIHGSGWRLVLFSAVSFLAPCGEMGLKHRPFLPPFQDGLSGAVHPPTQLLASLCLGAGSFSLFLPGQGTLQP